MVSTALAAMLCCATVAHAQSWIGAQTTIGQVALDYERNPTLADEKYRNVELVIADAALLAAPGHFPSGRTFLPVMGLGTSEPPVRAIVPSGEIPAGLGKGSEVSMTCTAQGYYSPAGQAVPSPKDGLLVLACGNVRVLR